MLHGPFKNFNISSAGVQGNFAIELSNDQLLEFQSVEFQLKNATNWMLLALNTLNSFECFLTNVKFLNYPHVGSGWMCY